MSNQESGSFQASPTQNRLLTEAETAKYLSVSRPFLRKSRMEGRRENHTPGPPWVKFGRAVRYAIDDLNAWIAEHRQEMR